VNTNSNGNAGIEMSLRVRDLLVGRRYLHRNGNFIRTIEHIDGDVVYWSDECGPGKCSRAVFLKLCQGFALENKPQTAHIKETAMTPDEKVRFNELQTAVISLSKNLAAVIEMNTILAGVIVPLATNYDAAQKQAILASLDELRLSAQGIRQSVGALSSLG
jgi:hypothetical protein